MNEIVFDRLMRYIERLIQERDQFERECKILRAMLNVEEAR